MTGKIKTAVVTGGHSYDVVSFHHLFRGFADLDVYIQHMDDFCSSSQEARDSYDAIVFYMMMMDGPTEEGLPWYMGKPKTAFSRLGETAQGIVVLHHSLLAYPDWEPWGKITGLADRGFEYHFGQQVPVRVNAADHPITAGVLDFEIKDETYVTKEPDEDSTILLSTNHALSTRAIGWTRPYKQSRVFCYQSGHDNQAWTHLAFMRILEQGIIWVSKDQ